MKNQVGLLIRGVLFVGGLGGPFEDLHWVSSCRRRFDRSRRKDKKSHHSGRCLLWSYECFCASSSSGGPPHLNRLNSKFLTKQNRIGNMPYATSMR